MQAPFQSPPPGPRARFAFSSDFKNRIWPNQNSTICAQGPNWTWLKDVTPAYLFEVAFYKFWRQRATAIARIPDGAVKPCWHDESITGNWCSLVNLLNPSVPTQEGPGACGHCKVEEYGLLFSCSSSSSGSRRPSSSRWPNSNCKDHNNNNNKYALCLPLRALPTLLRALHLP